MRPMVAALKDMQSCLKSQANKILDRSHSNFSIIIVNRFFIYIYVHLIDHFRLKCKIEIFILNYTRQCFLFGYNLLLILILTCQFCSDFVINILSILSNLFISYHTLTILFSFSCCLLHGFILKISGFIFKFFFIYFVGFSFHKLHLTQNN